MSLAAAYSLVLRWAGLRPHFSGVAVSLCQSVSLVQNEMSTCCLPHGFKKVQVNDAGAPLEFPLAPQQGLHLRFWLKCLDSIGRIIIWTETDIPKYSSQGIQALESCQFVTFYSMFKVAGCGPGHCIIKTELAFPTFQCARSNVGGGMCNPSHNLFIT